MDLVYEIPEAITVEGAILVPSLEGFNCSEASNLFGVEFYSGGFCQSYPVISGNQKKCLRLWIDDAARSSHLKHIEDISSYFSSHDIRYIKKYFYEPRALRLEDNSVIPGVWMDWVEGKTLIDYVKLNRFNSTLIKSLASKFYSMTEYMINHGLAHGDLSGKNIIVDSSGELIMIDYDTFYVAGQTENVTPSTKGVVCYQHPNRKQLKYISADMDYFSQLVIYLSLLIIAEKPEIVNENAEEGLLFQEEDMISKTSLINSTIYKKVSAIKNGEIQFLLRELVNAIGGPISEVRSIVDMKNSFPHEFIVEIKAPYCGRCGYQFGENNSTDIYCPRCGMKRETLK